LNLVSFSYSIAIVNPASCINRMSSVRGSLATKHQLPVLLLPEAIHHGNRRGLDLAEPDSTANTTFILKESLFPENRDQQLRPDHPRDQQ
jgi:hypothetical protein